MREKLFLLLFKLTPNFLIKLASDAVSALVRKEFSAQWNSDVLAPLDQRLARLETKSVQESVASPDRSIATSAQAQIDSRFLALAEQLGALEARFSDANTALLSASEQRLLGDRFHALSSTLPAEHIKLLTEAIPSKSIAVEVGCGSGAMAKLLSASRPDIAIVAIDIMDYETWKQPIDRVQYIHGDGLDYLLATDSGSVGAVLSLHVVEHLNNRQLRTFVDRSFLALEPGGALIIETPNVQSLYTLSRYYFMDPTHLLPRHPALIKFLLEMAGFANIEMIFLQGEDELLPDIDEDLRDFLLSASSNILIRAQKPESL